MKKLILLFVTVLSLSGLFVSAAHALSFTIDVGDRGYYTHGAGYWVNGVYWVWIPGHWNRSHTAWVHGHYAPRH